jgi:RHS repeat-associated protein
LRRAVPNSTQSPHLSAPGIVPTNPQYDGVANGAWGNLTQIAATTNSAYTGCTQESGFTKTADASNHLSGFSYDASGNTLGDGVNTYTWDGESQLKSGGGVNYLYDGAGRRVAKVGCKLYWYGSGGEILAETDALGNTLSEYIFFSGKRVALLPSGGNAQYYAEDLLGTSRVLTTNAGVVCYDADFYPFGGERTPYTNSCTQNNYKFESKERDSETGNDDFGTRYYSWRFGRWLSSDWSAVPVAVPYANLTNPQTLNLYSMVSDDPETSADLDGHASWSMYELATRNTGFDSNSASANAFGNEAGDFADSAPPNPQSQQDAAKKQPGQTPQQNQQSTQYVFYDVQGATASEAMANANMAAHGGCTKPGAGCTTVEFLSKPDTEVTSQQTSSGFSVTGAVVSANVTASITTTLPKWAGRAGASTSEQKAWDLSLAGLKSHEDGHAAIDRASVQGIKSAIQGTRATANGTSFQQAQSRMLAKLGALVKTKFKAAVAANQKRNDDYDN